MFFFLFFSISHFFILFYIRFSDRLKFLFFFNLVVIFLTDFFPSILEPPFFRFASCFFSSGPFFGGHIPFSYVIVDF